MKRLSVSTDVDAWHTARNALGDFELTLGGPNGYPLLVALEDKDLAITLDVVRPGDSLCVQVRMFLGERTVMITRRPMTGADVRKLQRLYRLAQAELGDR